MSKGGSLSVCAGVALVVSASSVLAGPVERLSIESGLSSTIAGFRPGDGQGDRLPFSFMDIDAGVLSGPPSVLPDGLFGRGLSVRGFGDGLQASGRLFHGFDEGGDSDFLRGEHITDVTVDDFELGLIDGSARVESSDAWAFELADDYALQGRVSASVDGDFSGLGLIFSLTFELMTEAGVITDSFEYERSIGGQVNRDFGFDFSTYDTDAIGAGDATLVVSSELELYALDGTSDFEGWAGLSAEYELSFVSVEPADGSVPTPGAAALVVGGLIATRRRRASNS
ncbi:MAG: hypothetical protein AAGB51_10355 [Planctomycetota bacterium]